MGTCIIHVYLTERFTTDLKLCRRTPLHWATVCENPEVIRALLAHGGKSEYTYLWATSIIWSLLESFTNVAEPNIKDSSQKRALDYATEKGFHYCSLLLAKTEGLVEEADRCSCSLAYDLDQCSILLILLLSMQLQFDFDLWHHHSSSWYKSTTTTGKILKIFSARILRLNKVIIPNFNGIYSHIHIIIHWKAIVCFNYNNHYCTGGSTLECWGPQESHDVWTGASDSVCVLWSMD